MLLRNRCFFQRETFSQAHSLTARFASGDGGAFGFETTDIGDNAFVIGAGITRIARDNSSLFLDVSTELGRDDYTAYHLRAGMRVPF